MKKIIKEEKALFKIFTFFLTRKAHTSIKGFLEEKKYPMVTIIVFNLKNLNNSTINRPEI